jgi:alpha-glucosidase
VANMTGRHGADDFNADVARALRRTIAPGRLLLAEHCHDASGDLAGDGWQGAMNYSGFTRPVWSWLRHPDLDLSFLGLPTAVPRLGAQALASTMRAFIAAAPWRSIAVSWSLLGSHDSARIRTVVGDPGTAEVAAGLLFTMPGAPMVFAGDEIGLEGVLGEDARRPFPWHRQEEWDRVTLGRYRGLAQVRRAHHALHRGGMRWVYAEGDCLAFLRESERERLLVFAARSGHRPIRLPADSLNVAGEAPNVYGGADALSPGRDELITLPGDGPIFQVWRLA